MSAASDAEETSKRLELLKLARHLLNEEHIKARADEYSQWLIDCDVAWKTQGIKLPYPASPHLPSEADVVMRALKMYNHIYPSPDADKDEDHDVEQAEVIESIDPSTVAAPEVPPVDDEVSTQIEMIFDAPVLDTVEPEPDLEPVPVTEPEVIIPVEIVAQTIKRLSAADLINQPELSSISQSLIAEVTSISSLSQPLVTEVSSIPQDTPKSLPLIKGIIKKGLLPGWLRPTGPTDPREIS